MKKNKTGLLFRSVYKTFIYGNWKLNYYQISTNYVWFGFCNLCLYVDVEKVSAFFLLITIIIIINRDKKLFFYNAKMMWWMATAFVLKNISHNKIETTRRKMQEESSKILISG